MRQFQRAGRVFPVCALVFALLVTGAFAADAPAPKAGQSAADKAAEAADKAASAVGSALESAGEFLDDAAITASVTARFLTQKGLDAMSIGVSTNDGIVSLTGQVDHAAQSSLAELVAMQVKGVRKVRNNLTVKTP